MITTIIMDGSELVGRNHINLDIVAAPMFGRSDEFSMGEREALNLREKLIRLLLLLSSVAVRRSSFNLYKVRCGSERLPLAGRRCYELFSPQMGLLAIVNATIGVRFGATAARGDKNLSRPHRGRRRRRSLLVGRSVANCVAFVGD